MALISTRKQTEIWLIGQMASSLSQTVLPSNKEVMALFFHYKQNEKQNINSAFHSTAKDVMEVWAKARIPVRLKKHVVSKVENIFTQWKNLKKNKENKAKRSDSVQRKEDTWKEALDNLFDIAHANALQMITIQEDKDFLLAQRQGRFGKMGNIDKRLAKQEEESQKKQERMQRKRVKEEMDRKAREEKVMLCGSSSDSDDTRTEQALVSSTLLGSVSNEPSTSSEAPAVKRQKRGRKSILSDKLAANLDLAKVSDRGAALILTPTLQHLGLDPAEYNVNSSSIRRERIKRRRKIAQGLKSEFHPEVPLCIHWDGKMLEDITGNKHVERLPVLVSGEGVQQLLSVPKLSSITGVSSASAVYEAVVDWGLCNKVKCMCFDTTPVNTGSWNGACVLLEQKFGKDLLWLACRHHIFELMLAAVVTHCLGTSSSPDILIFKRFKKHWPTLDVTNYQTVLTDDTASAAVADISAERITFCKNQLQMFQPRDDYRELLELTIIFLGGATMKKFSFKTPAGLHRARWMVKAIYSMKIWMLRSQFKLTKREEKGVRDICIFTVHIYITAWFRAMSPESAPRNDLQLLQDIHSYKNHNEVISSIAMKKFCGHLWYLSEELVALAFFDDELCNDTKNKMVQALNNISDQTPLKRAAVDPLVIQKKKLEDFVSSQTLRFFAITGISSGFLAKDVAEWQNDEEYISAKATISCMKVVNDIAERGVALMNDYNKLHTNNEEHKQFLLLVVQTYRQKYSDRKKLTLTGD